MASVRLVRHATLELQFEQTRLLVDPMLAAPGEIDPIENTPNQQRNPLVDLPAFDTEVFDALVITHLHRDHLDDFAREVLSRDLPVFCQPEDAESLAETFEDVRPIDQETTFEGITITRTPARHGHGSLADQMGPVSGFVFEESGDSLYVAGDTIWYDAVKETLDTVSPSLAVVNAGAAQFLEGKPITMTDDDVVAFARATDATVVAVHMDAINHCLLTRADLRERLDTEELRDQVLVPDDGQTVP